MIANAIKKRGFAMVLVMVIVVLACVLGLSYLSSASVHLAGSDNYRNAARARYLAESGLQHALYLANKDPNLVLAGTAGSPLGPFTVDATSDGYVLYAERDANTAGKYVLHAKSTIAGGISQAASVTITRQSTKTFTVNTGLAINGSLPMLPGSLNVKGDMYVNGAVYTEAYIDGNVNARSSISGYTNRITGRRDPNAAVVPMPAFRVQDYDRYTVDGNSFNALQSTITSLSSNNSFLNGAAVTASNPGGVVVIRPSSGGKVTVNGNVNFTGTMVINGDLALNGNSITFTAVNKYPTIVVNGNLVISGSAKATINGLAIVNGGLYGSGNTNGSKTTINGGLISGFGGYDYYLNGDHKLNYDANKCTVYNFDPNSSLGEQVTIKLKSWSN